ncbi:uncharacterized protein LOC128191589 [Crassostrea angulata]|uniref:uncharacterized protein LOC128191589 n=1 Tax=Magallana angulata TaxID=2784310 RepID=UPI0022B15576|nr:uncharacterized protein LOC128191589 [Crassostrea angulata]
MDRHERNVHMMKCEMKGIYLCFLLWNITTGSNTSCLNCVCAYNEDLSGIRDSQIRFSLYGLISSFCTQAGCRTAGAEDTNLISDCSSNSQSKTPACVVCDGTLTFSSKSAPEAVQRLIQVTSSRHANNIQKPIGRLYRCSRDYQLFRKLPMRVFTAVLSVTTS